jgi:hypothetical protein
MAKARKRSGVKAGASKAAKAIKKRVAAAGAGRAPSVGPIWNAIDRFERAARRMKPQPGKISDALAALEKAKKIIPRCSAKADGVFEFILLRSK